MKMFATVFPLLVTLAAVSAADQDYCYNDAVVACSSPTNKQDAITLANCNARYGAINELVGDLQEYTTTHITRSFEYLLMSTHFANYQKNRPGFHKLFRGLSDSAWHDAFDLIKYITKRGGEMNFHRLNPEITRNAGKTVELLELQSLSKALDIEKQMATTAHNIHREATRNRPQFHDPEISSFLENHFVHRHADRIRKLSGYTADVQHLFNTTDNSLALFLFDEYLQKE